MRDVSTLCRTLKATKLRQWTAKFVLSFLAEFQSERVRERREKRTRGEICFVVFERNVCVFVPIFWNKNKNWIADTFH